MTQHDPKYNAAQHCETHPSKMKGDKAQQNQIQVVRGAVKREQIRNKQHDVCMTLFVPEQ